MTKMQRVKGPLFKKGGSLRHVTEIEVEPMSPVLTVKTGRLKGPDGKIYEIESQDNFVVLYGLQPIGIDLATNLIAAIESSQVEWVKVAWKVDPITLLRGMESTKDACEGLLRDESLRAALHVIRIIERKMFQ